MTEAAKQEYRVVIGETGYYVHHNSQVTILRGFWPLMGFCWQLMQKHGKNGYAITFEDGREQA